MIIWVAALHCEAKPVIDYFRLKKSHAHHAFDVYQGDSMCCIVSGIGKLNSAAATAWIAAINRQSRSIAWINIGTAGSESHAIGSAWWVNKITDIESNRRSYPVPLIDSKIPTEHCLTHSQVDNEYHSQFLSDMEASAFFDTATRFSSAELVHCIKVISDNKDTPCTQNKNQVSQLIQQNMTLIAEFSQALERLNHQIENIEIAESDWQMFLTQAHFSQTQTSQLKNCLRFLLSKNDSVDSLMANIITLRNSDSILAFLEQRRIDRSRNL
jgi:adenosylhomocysteine nucleosidase